MTVLDTLIEELGNAQGPIRSTDLARRVGVSESALLGMIDVLTTKGVLAAVANETKGESITCAGVACAATCVGLDACPFIVDVPKTYSLVIGSAHVPNSVQ